MTEAELRVAAQDLFREMGMDDSSDTLDFFQKNAENGSSSEWKKSLKGPTARVTRRTSSDGTALVHLRKKYSTGLVSGQDQSTRNIKASDIEVSPPTGRLRKLSPAQKQQKSRFGYSGSTAKVADASGIGKGSSESKAVTSGYNMEETTKGKGVFKVKKSLVKSSTVAAPMVGRHSIKATNSSKLPTSVSASSVTTVRPFGKSASNGSVPTRNGTDLPPSSSSSSSSSNRHQISLPTASSTESKPDQNGALPTRPSSIPQPGSLPTHSRTGSHGSFLVMANSASVHKEPVPDTSGKKARSISVVHSSIDATKLNSINMRSLTRAKLADGKKSPEKMVSAESANVNKKQPSSFIPTPSASNSAATLGAGVLPSKGSITAGSSSSPVPTEQSGVTAATSKSIGGGGGSTQVLYTRKPSFKVIPMSTSSHRIMHTVQDGGAPKRLTSRNSQPALSPVAPPSGHHSNVAAGSGTDNSTARPSQGRVVKETVVLRHAKEAPRPQKTEVQEMSGTYDSLVVKERLSYGPSDREEQPAMVSTDRKVSTGEYDRLSPPIRTLQSPTEEEAVYDVVEGHENDNRAGNMERKLSNGEPESEKHQNLPSPRSNSAILEAKPLAVSPPPLVAGLQESVGEQAGTEIPVAAAPPNTAVHSDDPVPVPPLPSKGTVPEEKPRAAAAGGGRAGEKDSQAAYKNSGGSNFGFQRKYSVGKKLPPALIPRYTARSGETYSLAFKPKAAADPVGQMRATATSPQAGTVEEVTSPTAVVPRVIHLPKSATVSALPKITTAEAASQSSSTAISSSDNRHRRLQMSLSDSSTASAARSTPIFFKVQALSNESISGDVSRSSSSAASSNQDQLLANQMEDVTAGRKKGEGGELLVPGGGVALMASTERRAKLAMNWSEQSLDQNVLSMVTSTVEAVGKFMGAISSPPANNVDDGSGDEGVKENVWYQTVDSEDPPGGLCTSMSPVSSSTTPSTSAASPAQMKMERADTLSPRELASPRGGNFAEALNVSPPREMTWKSLSKERAKLAEKDASALEKTGRRRSGEEEQGPSVPTRTVSLSDNMATQKAVASSGCHLESETKTVGATTSHIDGSGMSRIRPRRNTVGSRPIRVVAAPPIPPKFKPTKPKAPPPPLPQASSATPASGGNGDQKSGIPVSNTKSSFPAPASSSHLRLFPANRVTAKGRTSGEGRNSLKSSRSPLQSTRASSDQRSKKDKPRTATGLPVRATNSTVDKKVSPPNALHHDYAVLEAPSDHDYAILDPEYHEEFYGYCESCTEPIIGMENGCIALKNTYHVRCFNCYKCGMSLLERKFYYSDGQLLCEKDFKITYEKCRNCKRNIHDRVVKALSYSYHPDCFKCTVCGRCLDGVQYTCDQKQKLYCIEDYHKVYASKCAICDKPIVPCKGQKKSLQVLAMKKTYHIQCYKCEQCGRELASRTGGGEKCYPLIGRLFCKECHTSTARRSNRSYKTPPPLSPAETTFVC